jgi:D-threo-aldose 1-dehydrogenase
MRTNRLGRTDVEVSVLGFGAAPIGNLYTPIDEEEARAAVETAWAGGVRYFDTAPHYGLGLSERRLGAALADKPRDHFTISTKVGRLLVANPSPTGSDLATGSFAVDDALTRERNYSGDGVRRSLEASLERLGLDRVDIVYVHDPDDHMDTAINQAVPALIELREQGVVGAIGAGMNYVDPLMRFATQADVDVLMVAGRWTLLDRSAERLLAVCEERGISVAAAAPFNSGLLARPWPADDAHFDYGPVQAGVLSAARAAATTCTDYGTSLPHAAMQFPLQHPAVACVVAGMRTPEQAAQNVGWATTDPPAGLLAALEASAPGSCG